MLNGKKIGVIVPAAGKGIRMGGSVIKQFIEVAGKPIIVRTIEHFQSASEVDLIVVATDKENLGAMRDLANQHKLSKIYSIIEGGAVRQDSVWNCLEKLMKKKVDIVLIHDAVRPFISYQLIKQVLLATLEDGASIVAVRPKDTIKQSDNICYAGNTLARKHLWMAQTPQGFQFPLIFKAYEKARRDSFYGTDDAILVERIGEKVRIVEGSYDNIKITTREDLDIAENIIKRSVTVQI
jgi:2-C-methyl-D-erythritol 4-phosphate cytidylyltransferase